MPTLVPGRHRQRAGGQPFSGKISYLSGQFDARRFQARRIDRLLRHGIEAGAAASLRAGRETLTVTAVDAIPRGHKIAVRAIAEGDRVLKYGEVIGTASQNIAEGNHVHTHNVVD